MSDKITQPSGKPTRKVLAGAVAGILTVIVTVGLKALGVGGILEQPGIAEGLPVVASFAAAWLVKDLAPGLAPAKPKRQQNAVRSPWFAGVVLATIAAAAVLSGCAGYPISDDTGRAGNYQTGAGLNVVEWDKLECQPELGLCGPTAFRMIGGKEQQSVRVAMYASDGTKVLEYEAEGIKAFEGQAFRAEVEKVLAEQYGDVSKAAVDAVVNLAGKAVGGL